MKLIEVFNYVHENIQWALRALAINIGGAFIYDVLKSHFRFRINIASLFRPIKRMRQAFIHTSKSAVRYVYWFVRAVFVAVLLSCALIFLITKARSLKVETQNSLLGLLLFVAGGVLLYRYLNKSKTTESVEVAAA